MSYFRFVVKDSPPLQSVCEALLVRRWTLPPPYRPMGLIARLKHRFLRSFAR